MAYKRSKTDSALYCPYCGHGFTMNYTRYMATYDAHKKGELYALTSCKYCKNEFLFRNMSAEGVRNTGMKAVIKIKEEWEAESERFQVIQ